MIRTLVVLASLSLGLSALNAQNPLSVSKPMEDNSVESQLKSFHLDERFEINLFADETMGIANPVCFRWDSAHRLWVLCTWAYPQLKPGTKPDDKLLILEDTDGDGRADTASTFLDGLNMPTGFELGHNGVYIGEGRDLIHVRDTDGDGKADSKELLFTGFGTGDTHQNINSFAWTPGGELLFCQGLHCFSHVQTPWGNIHLEEHGSWRLRPLRRQLNSYRRTSGGGNPWGYAFGKWGEPFVKSNGTGISELLPSMVQTDHIGGGMWGGAMSIGGTKIKSMIIEIVDSPHLPDDLQGDFLIAGYFARNIARLRPSVDGAGHRLETLEPLLTSSHNAFRPVDLNIGPDGALYVADWFNPIIGHYQASLRHPDRDETHGRIWRITSKGRPLLKSPNLIEMNADQLCEMLGDSLTRNRKLAKNRLMSLPKAEATGAAQRWLDAIPKDAPNREHKLFEAIGVFESHEVVNRPLLDELLRAENYRARAYATRVVGRWQDRIESPLSLLRKSATDEHPRVRLEALVAATEIREPASIAVASLAAGEAPDRFHEFALMQASHGLADLWKPALQSGTLSFEKPEHLARVVAALGDPGLVGTIRQLAMNPEQPKEQRLAMMALLATLGNTADSGKVLTFGADNPEILARLAKSIRDRNLKPPASSSELLSPVLANGPAAAKVAAIDLASAWKLHALSGAIEEMAMNATTIPEVRLAAIQALGLLGGNETMGSLQNLASKAEKASHRNAAVASLALRNVDKASSAAVAILNRGETLEIGPMVGAILSRKTGAEAIAKQLATSRMTSDQAKLIRRWMNTVGRADAALIHVLDGKIGATNPVPEYSRELVAKLVANAQSKGDEINGKRVFKMPLATCTSCHAVDGIEGVTTAMKGPNLSAVAAGLPVDLLIESVLWPDRQIKEGYAATTISTKKGGVISGFQHSRDKKKVGVRDLASGEVKTIPVSQIQTETRGGSMMPPGLTSSLTDQEFLDLIKFLSTLKTGSEP